MEVFLTNKLKKFIDPNKEESSQEFNRKWSAHLFYVDRKKCIVFTHKETLYSFVIPNFKKTNPNTLSEQITEELKNQLNSDGININSAFNYFELTSPQNIYFRKTDNDQKTLGWVRDLIQNIKVHLRFNEGDSLDKVIYYAHNNMNGIPVGSRHYARPFKMLLEKLK